METSETKQEPTSEAMSSIESKVADSSSSSGGDSKVPEVSPIHLPSNSSDSEQDAFQGGSGHGEGKPMDEETEDGSDETKNTESSPTDSATTPKVDLFKEPYDPSNPPAPYSPPDPQATIPCMRGSLSREGGRHVYRGEWAMNQKGFEAGELSSAFEIELQAPVNEDGTAQDSSSFSAPRNTPINGIYGSWFHVAQGPRKPLKIDDHRLKMRFFRNTEGSYNVKGEGENKFGQFTLEGLCHVNSDTGEQSMELWRRYQAKKNQTPRKRPTPNAVSTPREPSTRTSKPPEFYFASQSRSQRLPEPLRKCRDLLASTMKQVHAFWFLEPVDPVKLQIEDYYTIITDPMDFGTIKSKLDRGIYKNVEEFVNDVRLIFKNAVTYNVRRDNPVHVAARELSAWFEDRYRQMMAQVNSAAQREQEGTPSSVGGGKGKKKKKVEGKGKKKGGSKGGKGGKATMHHHQQQPMPSQPGMVPQAMPSSMPSSMPVQLPSSSPSSSMPPSMPSSSSMPSSMPPPVPMTSSTPQKAPSSMMPPPPLPSSSSMMPPPPVPSSSSMPSPSSSSSSQMSLPPKKAYYVEAAVSGKGKRKSKKKMDFKETSPTDALSFLTPEQLESVERKAMTGAIVVIQAPPPPAPLQPQEYAPYAEKGNRKKAPGGNGSGSLTPSSGTGGQFLSPAMDTSMSQLVEMQRQIHKLEDKIRELENKMNKSQVKGEVRSNTQPIALTYDEKIQLSEDIDALPAEKLGIVMALLQSNIDHSSHDGSSEEIEISLDDLPPETLRRLQEYVAKERGDEDNWEEEDPFFQEARGSDMFMEDKGEQVFKGGKSKKKRTRPSSSSNASNSTSNSNNTSSSNNASSNGEAPTKRPREDEPSKEPPSSSTVSYDFDDVMAPVSSDSTGVSTGESGLGLGSSMGGGEDELFREEGFGGTKESDLDMSGLEGLDDSFF